ncbi:IS1 family transposase [bacterium]|nr:MAG: IS1 family transposase [bacterium]
MGNSTTICPKCESEDFVKSGIVMERQRYRCKNCNYHYSVQKKGKEIHPTVIIKALQLYLEGISYREIERLIGISHVTVMNWVKKYGLKSVNTAYQHPNFVTFTHKELLNYLSKPEKINQKGLIISPIGDKYLVIFWNVLKQ